MNGGEMKYIHRAFESNWIAPLGENVDEFERAVREYIGVPQAVALSSGTAAIHLALRYLDVGPQDIVFCSDVTFAASCNPIRYLQAEPVFIDSDEESWGMSAALLAGALHDHERKGKLPKAAVVVDLYGLPADYGRILPLLQAYGVPVVEDAAEAFGSSYGGRMCGCFGDVGVLSFNANKLITTSGGGMVLSGDEAAAKKMKYWATQAREKARHYEHREIGYNYRLSNICAGIGRGQMETVGEYVQARRRIYNRYVQALSDLPVSFYPQIDGAGPNCWLSVMSLKEDCGVTPDEIIDALERENVEARPFWKPMHMQPVYESSVFYHEPGKVPVGERLFASSVCLPSGSAMTKDVQEEIVGIIRSCFPNGGC